MEDLDLYNVRSVRLAETTKVKLFLPGLGSGLWEEEDNTKSGTLNSADAKKAKKRLAKMRKACNVGPGEADGIMVILEEEKQTEDDPDSDSDSDEDGESLLPSFLLNMTNFHPALAAEPSQKKKKPVDKWLVNKKDPWAKQSGRNAPIMGQTSPWSELNRQGSEGLVDGTAGGAGGGGGGGGGSSLTHGPERSANSSASILTSMGSSSGGLPSTSGPKGSPAMAQGGINSTTGPSASQPPARVPVWDRLTAASQSKSLPQPTPHHADSQPRVLKAVQAKTVCLGFNFGPSPLIVAPDGNNESSSSSLYGIYDTGQWASTGGMSGREISPSRQARLQGQSGRFGSPGSVAASLSRRKVNSNPSMTSIQPGGGSSRPPHPSQPTPQLSSQQGPAVAAMASLFQASMGMLQAASGASDGETSKKRTSREGQLTTPRGGAGDRDTMTLGGGPGGGSGTLPTLPMHQLQMNDPGESMSKPFAGATSSMGGSFSSTHQRATNASTSNPAATAAALPVGSQSVKLTAALYGPSRIGNSPSRRS